MVLWVETAMAMHIQCPRCRRDFRVPEETVGRTARCQSCSQVFRVPARQPRPVVQPAAPVVLPATPVVQPVTPAILPAAPIAGSLDSLLAEDAAAAPLPRSAQPKRPVVSPARPNVRRRPRPRSQSDVSGLAFLEPLAQFLIGLPITYVGVSYAVTATYESQQQFLLGQVITAFAAFVFLAGVFNWSWFFLNYGKFARMSRDFGSFYGRMMCLFFGGFLGVMAIFGSSDDRPVSHRMWPLNGPKIEAKEPERNPYRMPSPRSSYQPFR